MDQQNRGGVAASDNQLQRAAAQPIQRAGQSLPVERSTSSLSANSSRLHGQAADSMPKIIQPSTEIGPGFEGQVPAVSSAPINIPPQTTTQSPFAVHRDAPMPVPLQTSNQIDQGHYQSQTATHIESMNTYSTMQPTTSPPEGLAHVGQKDSFLQENYAQQPDTKAPAQQANQPIATTQPATHQTAPQHEQQEAQIPKKKKEFGKKKILLIAAALGTPLLLALLAALLYFLWYLPNQPNNLVARSLVGTAVDNDSSHLRVIVDYKIRSTSELFEDLSLDGGISTELNIPDLQEAAGGSLSIRKTEIKVGGAEPFEFSIAEIPVVISGVATNDTYYVKLNGVENILSGADEVSELLIDQVKDEVAASKLSDLRSDINQIIQEATSDLAELNDSWYSSSFDGVSYLEELRGETGNEFTACLQNTGQLDSIIKESVSSYLEFPILEVLTDHGKEKIRETINTRHFTVQFNEANYSQFTAKIAAKARSNQQIVDCIKDSDYADILENPQFTGDQEIKLDPDGELPDIIFDIWIDGDTNIRQLQYRYDQDQTVAELSIGLDILDPEPVTIPESAGPVSVLSDSFTNILNTATDKLGQLEAEYSTADSGDGGLNAFGDSGDDIAALEDIEKIKEQLTKFAEEGATVPLNEEQLTGALTDEFKEELSAEYNVVFTGSNVISEANEIHYSNRAYCDGNFVSTTLEPQSFALLMRLPGGGYSCIDNDKGPNNQSPSDTPEQTS